MKRHILYGIFILLASLSVPAQEVYRTFDYQSPALSPATLEAKAAIATQLRSLQDAKRAASSRAAQIIAAYEAADKAALKTLKVKASDVDVNKLSAVLADTIVLEDEKLQIVRGASVEDKSQLAALGKAFVDEADLFSAEAVLRTLQNDHSQYAYTLLLSAYCSQAYGVTYGRAADNLSRQNKMSEMNAAATQFEELAKSAKDSLEVYRDLLLTAGTLRYEAQEEVMCRTDFQEVLRLHPSVEDSIDVGVMLAYFDRVQAAEALRSGDEALAQEYYDSAIARYGAYLNTAATLPSDVYTAEAADGYLFCKSNRAALQRRKNDKDISGYRDLLSEANRFLAFRNDDIRPHRYRLSAYFQMCMADSTQFRSLRNDYVQSMAYVTQQQFPDSLYTYDDYNMAQQGATWLSDDTLRAKYLRKCIATYSGESGEIKGNLLTALVNSEKRNGNVQGEINARKMQLAEALAVDDKADVGGNELHLAEAYFNILSAEKEKATLPLDSIYHYAALGNALADKYLDSPNEDYAESATTLKFNCMIDLLALAKGDARTKYYEEYRDLMLQKIAWSKENDVSSIQRHTNNLFRVAYNYILGCQNEAELPAVAGASYQLFYRQFEGEKDENLRSETATAYLGNIDQQLMGRILELKVSDSVLTAVCDTVDYYILLMNHATATDPTLQQEQYRFFTELRQNYVLGKVPPDYQKRFDRARFLSNHAAIQDKGCTAYLAEFIRSSKACRFYHDNIVAPNPDLTPSEKTLAYSALATGFYSQAITSYDQYRSQKTNAAKEAALQDFEQAYYYSARAVKLGLSKFSGNISTLEDFAFAAPAVEKAQTRLALEDAEELERSSQPQQPAEETQQPSPSSQQPAEET